MKLTYDPKHNIAYIRFKEKTEPVETIRLSDTVNADLAADGTIYGIELLNANEQLREQKTSKFVFEQTGGKTVNIDLTKASS